MEPRRLAELWHWDCIAVSHHSSFIEHFLVWCARVVKGKSKQTKELKSSREEKPFKNNNMRKNLISSLTEVEVSVRSVPCLLLSFYLSHSHALFANFRVFPSNSSMSLWCLVLYLILGTFERLCTSRCWKVLFTLKGNLLTQDFCRDPCCPTLAAQESARPPPPVTPSGTQRSDPICLAHL